MAKAVKIYILRKVSLRNIKWIMVRFRLLIRFLALDLLYYSTFVQLYQWFFVFWPAHPQKIHGNHCFILFTFSLRIPYTSEMTQVFVFCVWITHRPVDVPQAHYVDTKGKLASKGWITFQRARLHLICLSIYLSVCLSVFTSFHSHLGCSHTMTVWTMMQMDMGTEMSFESTDFIFHWACVSGWLVTCSSIFHCLKSPHFVSHTGCANWSSH